MVPLWPQLRPIVRDHLRAQGRAGGLLFASPTTGTIIRDVRKAFDAIAERAGWETGEIRSKMFRHTYCAARLQTLDGGYPVSPFTVAREMGHGGTTLVERIYGHLGTVHHRSEHVEYRVEQHREALGERLVAMQAS